MKTLLTVCHRLSLFPFLVIAFLFYLFIIGNAQEFLDSSQIMLMNSIISISVFALCSTANLIILAIAALMKHGKGILPYLIYGVSGFIVVFLIMLLMKSIDVWV